VIGYVTIEKYLKFPLLKKTVSVNQNIQQNSTLNFFALPTYEPNYEFIMYEKNRDQH